MDEELLTGVWGTPKQLHHCEVSFQLDGITPSVNLLWPIDCSPSQGHEVTCNQGRIIYSRLEGLGGIVVRISDKGPVILFTPSFLREHQHSTGPVLKVSWKWSQLLFEVRRLYLDGSNLQHLSSAFSAFFQPLWIYLGLFRQPKIISPSQDPSPEHMCKSFFHSLVPKLGCGCFYRAVV